MKKEHMPLLYIIASLSVLGIVLAYILGQDFYFSDILKNTGDKLSVFSELSRNACGDDASYINCNKIKNSPYSSVFGIPLAFWGMFYFLLMTAGIGTLIFLKERLRVVHSMLYFWFLIFGSTFDLVLLFISVFKINALCPLCISTYLAIWISLGLYSLFMVKNGIFNETIGEAFRKESRKIFTLYFPAALIIIVFSISISYSMNGNLKLSRDAYIEKYKKAAYEKILAEFPREEIVSVNPSRALTLGRDGAPVEIIEFSDFLCPYCSVASAALDAILKEKPEKVRIVYLNYPLDSECNKAMQRQLHAGACLLARGSISAAQQGKFDEYHIVAFQAKVENPGKDHVEKIARFTGMDVKRFLSDLDSPKTAEELKRQMALADKLGINSTPTIFINGKKFKYRPDKELLEKIIDQEYDSINKERLKIKQ